MSEKGQNNNNNNSDNPLTSRCTGGGKKRPTITRKRRRQFACNAIPDLSNLAIDHSYLFSHAKRETKNTFRNKFDPISDN